MNRSVEKALERYVEAPEPYVIQSLPPLDLRRHAAKIGALPVILDMGGCYALTPDLSVVSFTWCEPSELTVERDQRTVNMVLAQAAWRHPDLAALEPVRPESASDCELCGGTGKLLRIPETIQDNVMCSCGGLGWIPAGAATDTR